MSNIQLKHTAKESNVTTVHSFIYKDMGTYFTYNQYEIYKNNNGVINTISNEYLVQTKNRKNYNGEGGYKQFSLVIDGQKFTYPMHKWLMTMEYGVIPNGFEVDHKDGDIYNNDISNLRIVSRTYNRSNGKKLVDSSMSKFFVYKF